MQIIYLILFLIITSCSKTSEVSISSKPSFSIGGDLLFYGYVYAGDSDLPSCDKYYNKKIYYLLATNEFRYCLDGSWVAVNLKGDKGDKGETGVSALSGQSLEGPVIQDEEGCGTGYVKFVEYSNSISTSTCISTTSVDFVSPGYSSCKYEGQDICNDAQIIQAAKLGLISLDENTDYYSFFREKKDELVDFRVDSSGRVSDWFCDCGRNVSRAVSANPKKTFCCYK